MSLALREISCKIRRNGIEESGCTNSLYLFPGEEARRYPIHNYMSMPLFPEHYPYPPAKLNLPLKNIPEQVKGPLALRHSLSNATDTVLCMALSKDRRTLFVGCQDSVIRVWDTLYFNLLAELKGHTRSVLNMTLYTLEHSTLLLSCGRDNSIRIWDLKTYTCIGIACAIPACMFSMLLEGDYIYGGLMDTTLAVINMKTLLKEMATATDNELDLKKSRAITNLAGHLGYVFIVHVSSTKKYLFSGSGDGSVKVWSLDDPAYPVCVETLKDHDDCVTVVQEVDYELENTLSGKTQESYYIASGTKSGSVKIWKYFSGRQESYCIRTVCLGSEILAFCLQKEVLFCSQRNGSVVLFDRSSLTVLYDLKLHDGPVMCFISSSSHFCSGGCDSIVHIWDVSLCKENEDDAKESEFSYFDSLHGGSLSSPTSPRGNSGSSLNKLLNHLNMTEYCDVFKKNAIDLSSLFLLNNEDLREMGIPIGPRRRLLYELERSSSRKGNGSSVQVHSAFDNIIRTLREFVEIPTVSIDENHREDCWKGAKFVEKLLLSNGADVRLIQSIPHKNPVVIGKVKVGEGAEDKKLCKIIVYGHYDVQPAVSELWSCPPFALTGVNGYLYGRGASDNKGPITAMIFGAKELLEEKLNVELVFLIDGEEEAGFEGGGFEQAVNDNLELLENADAILISNTYWIGTERPCLVYGMRGSIHLKVTIYGPSNNLHSGVHGGSLYEPLNDLVHILSLLQDESGRILIPNFFDGVRDVKDDELRLYEQLTKDFDLNEYKHSLGVSKLRSDDCTEILMNRWRYPYFCVHGIHTSYPGPYGTVAAISKSCSAIISIRTVPDQCNDKVVGIFENFIRDNFTRLNSYNRLNIEVISSGNWWLGDPSSKYFHAAESAIKSQWGVDPLYIREGGTMPTSSFLESALNAPVIHIPFGQITDQAHLENERVRILNLMKGKDVFKDFVRNSFGLKK